MYSSEASYGLLAVPRRKHQVYTIVDGAVLGSAPKGTRFKVTKRNGDWAQVESDRLKGWIKSEFLGPNEPR